MSIEVVRAEASSRGIWPCALCRNGGARVWRYCRYSRSGGVLSEVGHLYLCNFCVEPLRAALATPDREANQ